MTNQEIEFAIAEAIGWSKEREIEPGFWVWRTPNGKLVGQTCVPEYTQNLNAIHEAESALRDQWKWNSYVHALKQIASPGIYGWQAEWDMVHSTALQRCHAFLRTIGRWTEENAS